MTPGPFILYITLALTYALWGVGGGEVEFVPQPIVEWDAWADYETEGW